MQRSAMLLSAGMAVLSVSNGVMAFVSQSAATRNPNVLTRPAFVVAPKIRSSTTPLTPRFMFGFGSKDETPEEGYLAKFSGLPAAKFDPLSEYIRLWAELFEDENKQRMGLTTPVKVFPSMSDAEGVTASSGVRIVFQKTNTGTKYKSSKDEKAAESAETDEGAPKKKKETRLEGGVEVLVETLDGGDMIVRARRSDFDEDTLIKEMSEETILSELKRAMDVWRRDNK